MPGPIVDLAIPPDGRCSELQVGQAVVLYRSMIGKERRNNNLYELVGGFEPTHLKNMRKSNWIISPRDPGNHKK